MRMARGIARTKASIFEIEQAGHRAAQTSKTRTRVSPSTPQGTPRVVTRLSPKAAPVRLLCRRLCVGSDSLLPIIALVPQDLPDLSHLPPTPRSSHLTLISLVTYVLTRPCTIPI